MVRLRKYIGLVLIVVYAFFFASTNFFYHYHQTAGSRIVHSHPFSGPGHSHTANQISLIAAADSAVYEESALTAAPEQMPVYGAARPAVLTIDDVFSSAILSVSLRAPPSDC